MSIDELREKIISANIDYWVNNNPKISDAEYDKLVEELKQLNPDDSLVHHIGGSSGPCVHPYPMLSLDKAYSKEEVISWMNKVKRFDKEQFLISPKLDGCTCRITNGRLFTRGDGVSGEEITRVRPITTFHCWNNSDDLGEIVITNSVFDSICKSGEYTKQDGSIYQNSRNATAGILGRKQIDINVPKVLTFMSYNAVQFPVFIETLQNNWDNEVNRIVELFKDYPIDGLVIKLMDDVYANSLGTTDHHPRGSIAYKFKNISAKSKVVDIVWQPGKEFITPVAKIEPICINGSNITQVTLHNWRNVHVQDIQIGDYVVIERAGDVIPKVVGTDYGPKRMMYNEPSECPDCNTTLKHTDVELYCPNPDCKGKILQKLECACKILKLDGFGQAVLNELYNSGVVRNLYELFSLQERMQRIHCDLGPTISMNLINQINNKLNHGVPDYELLAALCIPTIGLVTSKSITRTVPLINIINDIKTLDTADITPGKLKELKKFMNRKGMGSYLLALAMKANVKSNTSDAIVRKICFTGTMYKPRKALEIEAELKGYTAVNQVTRDLDVLVVPDLSHHSSKVATAKKYGIRIITEQEFEEIK